MATIASLEYSMQTLTVQPWSPELSEGPITVPDYLIHRLGQLGPGEIYSTREYKDGTKADAKWWYRPRGGASGQTLMSATAARFFRAQLARWAVFTGTPDIKLGHSLFGVQSHPEWASEGLHRFCVFICNEPQMDCWAKLYLYGVVSESQ